MYLIKRPVNLCCNTNRKINSIMCLIPKKSTEGHRGPAGEPVSSAFHTHRLQPAQSTPIAHPFGSGGSLFFFFSFVFCHPNDENVGREKKKKIPGGWKGSKNNNVRRTANNCLNTNLHVIVFCKWLQQHLLWHYYSSGGGKLCRRRATQKKKGKKKWKKNPHFLKDKSSAGREEKKEKQGECD